MSRALRAKIGFWLSIFAVIYGVYYVWGLGAAMIVGGILGALSFLFLTETDDPKEDGP